MPISIQIDRCVLEKGGGLHIACFNLFFPCCSALRLCSPHSSPRKVSFGAEHMLVQTTNALNNREVMAVEAIVRLSKSQTNSSSHLFWCKQAHPQAFLHLAKTPYEQNIWSVCCCSALCLFSFLSNCSVSSSWILFFFSSYVRFRAGNLDRQEDSTSNQ